MIAIFEKLDRYFLSNWRLAVLDLNKGLWTVEPNTLCIPYLKAENANGRHILIQPKDPSHYLMADDLSRHLLQTHHMLADGSFKSGRMVVETSPHNFQVWIHSREPLSVDQKRLLLQKLKSDPGADPNNRFGRCPGFRNRKEKYQNTQGFFPLAKLIWIDWKHQTLIPKWFLPHDSNIRSSFPSTPVGGGVSKTLQRPLSKKQRVRNRFCLYTRPNP
jgi:hypothetical protein